jgi:hypothetical protein
MTLAALAERRQREDGTAMELARRLRMLVKEGAPESDTSAWVRDLLCDLCGWRKRDLRAQTLAPRGPVDWHARLGATGLVHIEVKRVGRTLQPEMILKYLREDAAAARNVLGILTNGAEWEVWLGGKRFARREVDPVLVERLRAFSQHERALDTAARLESFKTRLESRGLIRRALGTAAIEVAQGYSPLLDAVHRSRATRSAWAKAYAEKFSGPLPNARLRFGEFDGLRINPLAVTARLAMRSPGVARSAHRQVSCLLGTRNFGAARYRDIRDTLDGAFDIPWA